MQCRESKNRPTRCRAESLYVYRRGPVAAAYHVLDLACRSLGTATGSSTSSGSSRCFSSSLVSDSFRNLPTRFWRTGIRTGQFESVAAGRFVFQSDVPGAVRPKRSVGWPAPLRRQPAHQPTSAPTFRRLSSNPGRSPLFHPAIPSGCITRHPCSWRAVTARSRRGTDAICNG